MVLAGILALANNSQKHEIHEKIQKLVWFYKLTKQVVTK